jgi:hypothetical protein
VLGGGGLRQRPHGGLLGSSANQNPRKFVIIPIGPARAGAPFAGSLDYETVAKDLLAVVKTKKTELLSLALFIRLLRTADVGRLYCRTRSWV